MLKNLVIWIPDFYLFKRKKNTLSWGGIIECRDNNEVIMKTFNFWLIIKNFLFFFLSFQVKTFWGDSTELRVATGLISVTLVILESVIWHSCVYKSKYWSYFIKSNCRNRVLNTTTVNQITVTKSYSRKTSFVSFPFPQPSSVASYSANHQ